jgi:hypothetical protein
VLEIDGQVLMAANTKETDLKCKANIAKSSRVKVIGVWHFMNISLGSDTVSRVLGQKSSVYEAAGSKDGGNMSVM